MNWEILTRDGKIYGWVHPLTRRNIEVDFFAEWQQYQREADLRVAAQVRKIVRAIN
jgi:hypothetical protein